MIGVFISFPGSGGWLGAAPPGHGARSPKPSQRWVNSQCCFIRVWGDGGGAGNFHMWRYRDLVTTHERRGRNAAQWAALSLGLLQWRPDGRVPNGTAATAALRRAEQSREHPTIAGEQLTPAGGVWPGQAMPAKPGSAKPGSAWRGPVQPSLCCQCRLCRQAPFMSPMSPECRLNVAWRHTTLWGSTS